MLDLFTEFGGQYRITFDPACGRGERRDPADMQIPGRFGTIYADGEGHLRVDIDGHVRLAAKVGQIPGCVLVQDGDTEKTYRFPLSAFEQVALIVKPRKRRHHSDARRQQAVADLARARAVLGKDSPRGSSAA
jgi:hypothetical protein